jgi:hypothetical protein
METPVTNTNKASRPGKTIPRTNAAITRTSRSDTQFEGPNPARGIDRTPPIETLAVAEADRFSADNPCPVCGGDPSIPIGQSRRCAGYYGKFGIFCTREDYAGHCEDVESEPPSYKHLYVDCPCGVDHASGGRRSQSGRPGKSRRDLAPESLRDVVYREALQQLELSEEAHDHLFARGMNDREIGRGLFRSIPRNSDQSDRVLEATEKWKNRYKAVPGFLSKNGDPRMVTASEGHDGFIIPYIDEQEQVLGYQVRWLKHPKFRYWLPPGTQPREIYHIAGPQRDDIWLTEGALKASVAADLSRQRFMGVVGQVLGQTHLRALARMNPSRVIVALDREQNKQTEKARVRWFRLLQEAGFRVFEAVWEA